MLIDDLIEKTRSVKREFLQLSKNQRGIDVSSVGFCNKLISQLGELHRYFGSTKDIPLDDLSVEKIKDVGSRETIITACQFPAYTEVGEFPQQAISSEDIAQAKNELQVNGLLNIVKNFPSTPGEYVALGNLASNNPVLAKDVVEALEMENNIEFDKMNDSPVDMDVKAVIKDILFELEIYRNNESWQYYDVALHEMNDILNFCHKKEAAEQLKEQLNRMLKKQNRDMALDLNPEFTSYMDFIRAQVFHPEIEHYQGEIKKYNLGSLDCDAVLANELYCDGQRSCFSYRDIYRALKSTYAVGIYSAEQVADAAQRVIPHPFAPVKDVVVTDLEHFKEADREDFYSILHPLMQAKYSQHIREADFVNGKPKKMFEYLADVGHKGDMKKSSFKKVVNKFSEMLSLKNKRCP